MTPDSQPPAKSSNGMMNLLSVLAQSTNKWVQLGTLVLIALSGFGNWVATWNSADRNKAEIEISRRVAWEGEQRIKAEVIRQVQDMHDWMEQAQTSFRQGNADSAENRRMLVKLTQDVDELERKLNATKTP
jgi:hypothetical protein